MGAFAKVVEESWEVGVLEVVPFGVEIGVMESGLTDCGEDVGCKGDLGKADGDFTRKFDGDTGDFVGGQL